VGIVFSGGRFLWLGRVAEGSGEALMPERGMRVVTGFLWLDVRGRDGDETKTL
jgi:hypothetical protein